MDELRTFNKKERMKIYRLARRLFKSGELNIYTGLCEFIAEAIKRLHEENHFSPNGYHEYSVFQVVDTKGKYWSELYAQCPDIYSIYWWDNDKDRGKALDNIINGKPREDKS